MAKTRKSHKKKITHKRKTKLNKTNKHKKSKIYIKKGGCPIDSGAFGCVFDPALQCKETGLREQGKISKLMLNKYAVQEFNIINNVKEKLSSIPNYSDYFLVDGATLCKPSQLTESDLDEFNEICRALTKKNANESNINKEENLDLLTILNLPNGGLSLSKFIENNEIYKNVYKIQVALLKLLKNGIIPMNSKNMYHNDIKASNILVDTKDTEFKIRLIDWGFLTEYVPSDEIPAIWKSRRIVFNAPFSIILFSDEFYSDYATFILKYNNYDDFNNAIDLFLNDYIQRKKTEHFSYIVKIFYILYKKNDLGPGMASQKVSALPQIINYLKQILLNFTKKIFESKAVSSSSSSETIVVNNGEQAIITVPRVDQTSVSQNNNSNRSFNSLTAENIVIDTGKQTAMENIIKMELKIYLDSVFIKNLDIWGFIMCYLPIIQMLSDKYSSLNKLQKQLFEALKGLFILYLFSDPNEPILEKANFYETLDNITLLLK